MPFLVVLAIQLMWAGLSAHASKDSGGSVLGGFAWGLCLGVFGLGVVLYMSMQRNKKAIASAS